jgi:SAM-dependent methyltransferase
MYRCDGCQTAFVFPFPSSAEISRFYDRFHLSSEAGGFYDEIEDRMQADFPAKIARIIGLSGGNPGRLLDVGCGKGFFVKACIDRGIHAEGIDLSVSGVRHATEVLGVKAIAGDLASLKPQLGIFDTVTFWATIEHLADPIGMLRHVRDVLKPGGRIFLSTGVGADWLDRLLPGVTQWYDPPQHLFVFSLDGLQRSLSAAGFQIEDTDACFERTRLRKLIRIVRGAFLAASLRACAEVGRLRRGEFPMTRFPLGNHMSIVARRSD